jgi:hypothetical protein
MLCKEKATLLEIYLLTARKYADVVSRLSEDVGALSHEDFEIIHKRVKEIHQDLIAARMNFTRICRHTAVRPQSLSGANQQEK